MERNLTRREFLKLSTVAAAGLAIAACTKTEEPTKAPEATKAPDAAAPTATPEPVVEAEAKEAPMLAEMVAAGSLPEMSERIPQNPNVCPVATKVGKFGGTFRRRFRGVSDRWGPTKMRNEGYGWYNQDLSIRANIAESWDVNEDGSEWTFHLRKGTKRGDGEPFDVNGTKWYLEYWAGDETLNSSGNPPGWASTGTPRVMGDITFPDDYTMTIKFADPKPLFVYDFQRSTLNNEPGYELARYHMELVEDKAALEAMVKEAGFETWDQYFFDRRYWYMNPDYADCGVWNGQNPLSEEIHIMTRNPYFFQVDKEGQQLPYVDQVNHRLGDNTEVFNMWIVNGEIDFQARGVGIGNYTLYKENEANGDYQVYLGTSASHTGIQLNLACKNERLAGFFNKRDVRIALMHAINREEVNDLTSDGLQTPRQYSPLASSPQYYEKLSNSHIEFDPAMSNELLDAAGYTEKDGEGFRLWDDGSGEAISFVVEGTSETSDVMEMVTKYWADVGVKITYKYFERSLYTEHFRANEIEGAFWGGDRTVLPLAPGAPIFRGTMIDRPWCAGWGIWFNSQGADASGVEPPQGHWIWDIWDLWDQLTKVADPDKQNELFFKICDIWAEEVPMIGILGERPAPIIVKNGVTNYLQGMPLDDTIEDEHLLKPSTYFWDI